MSIQIQDKMDFEGRTYYIQYITNYDETREKELQSKLVGFKKNIKAKARNNAFYPQNYGMSPKGGCSACWRGYLCEYIVKDEQLYLEALAITDENDFYPPINGVLSHDYSDTIFEQKYRHLSLPLNFNGTMEIEMFVETENKSSISDDPQNQLYLTFNDGKIISIVTQKEKEKERRLYIETHKDEIIKVMKEFELLLDKNKD